LSKGPSTVVLGPLREFIDVERNDRGNERLLITNDYDLADEAMRSNCILENSRGHVLANGSHDKFLLAPGDPHEALGRAARVNCGRLAIDDRHLRCFRYRGPMFM
jgi:hypothetical protein